MPFAKELHIRHDLLNRIGVGRVWRQREKLPRAHPDRFANGLAFPIAKIVHDDDIADCKS